MKKIEEEAQLELKLLQKHKCLVKPMKNTIIDFVHEKWEKFVQGRAIDEWAVSGGSAHMCKLQDTCVIDKLCVV